jgi:cytochrome oxidase Cu insertion factor (SCO1/SenC/PrrC family)
MKNKKPLFITLILLLIFIIPFQAAKRLYLHDANFLPKARTQHGYLIQPPLKINQLTLYDFDENLFDAQKLHGKWLLLYIGPNNCLTLCKKNLYQLQQIHTATGKDQSRVLRVKISFKKDRMPNKYPGFLQLTVSKQQFSNFIKNLSIKTLALSLGAIYLVDPLGNVIMAYTLDANPSGLLKDLKHLLGVSQIG